MALKTGQRVRHKTRGITGSVLEIDAGTVYIEAANGVEMQFAEADLEPDVPAPQARPAASVAPDPKHAELVARIPERVVGLAAVRYAREPAPSRRAWDDLPALDKLQWISRVSGLTLAQLADLVRTGKARQIEAHAAVLAAKAKER